MKKLLRYLRPYRRESVLGPLFKLLEASFELFVPLVIADLVDVGIANADVPAIWRMCLLLVVLGLIGLVCSITAQYFAARAAVGFATGLRSDLFRQIGALSYAELDTVGTSTLITRLTSDVNQVQSGVNLVLRLFLRSPFIVFGAMVMAFTIDLRAALVFAVAIPLLCVVVFGVMLASIPLYRRVQEGLDQLTRLTREHLTGARVIRAFNRQADEQAAFERSSGALVESQLFVGKISALTNPMTYVIVNLATAALLWTGALRVQSGALSQGDVIALVNYMAQILVELIKLANLILSVTRALACARRIEGVLSLQPSLREAEDAASAPHAAAGEEKVAFDHVSFAYPGAQANALDDIHLTVRRGETVGIIGGTGSGKSTLVNLIARFYDATEGTVRVDGRDVRTLPLGEVRGQTGIVPQKTELFKGTIADNLRWGDPDADETAMEAALEAAQALDFVRARGKGLESWVTQGGKNLSGGQRQRLAIARALVRRPEILILDDSASALDYATDANLRRAIRSLGGGMTVFIVSQRTASVWNADQILVLDDGRQVGLGTHEELLATCPVYQEIYRSQFGKEGA